MMFYTGFISVISTKLFIAPFSLFMPWLCLTCIVGLPIEKECVLIIPRCPITPCPCRCRICRIITESTHPNVRILDEVLKKSIGSSIRYWGQITNIVRNIILTIGPSPFPGHQQRKILVAPSCCRVGDIIIFTHWKKKKCNQYWIDKELWQIGNCSFLTNWSRYSCALCCAWMKTNLIKVYQL